jgi:dipeptidyl aminopeptidase/acylaminoacyl peptidase
MRRSLTVMILLGTIPVLAAADDPHPFNARDLHEMQRISGPAVSPDGTRIAFTVRTTDFDADRGRTDIWTVGIDGRKARPMTTDPAGDSSPAWAPDGKNIFFLSSRSGSSQVWRIAVDGGEARPVTDLPLDVGGFILSPDGGRLAVALEVFPDCEDLECTVKRIEERESSKTTGVLYTQLMVRHWDGWKDGRRSHLFTVPVKGGDPVDVMKGMDADCPSKPFGGMEEAAFTPDGSGLVFTARNVGREEAWSTDFDLWLASVDGAGAPSCLTESNKAWDTGPVFSPDGKTLAYAAMKRPGYEADRFGIMLRSWPGGETRELAAGWDRSARSMAWSPDGKTLWVTASDVGTVDLFAVDVAGGRVRKVVERGTVRSPSATADRIVFGLDHFRSPVELYSVKPDGTDFRRLTDLNGKRLAAATMGEYEQFSFPGWNGETVYGYVFKPAEFQPDGKYPVAFLIHGGPQGSFSSQFHYRWNPQAYTGAGYAAVIVDFHGSTGYGQEFTDSIRGDWGGKPLVDLKKGLAAVLERYTWMDGNRTCALGASYGGYMIDWIAGMWPDRFRCLVSHDGTFDTRAMYFETEELWFPEWDNEGTPWDNPEAFALHNPVLHVDKWRTPMLIIQGALDFRVPETQSIGAFNALQRRGIPSEFLYFPDENHWVLRPHNSIQWHRTVLAWLDRWTGAGHQPSNP